MIKLKNLCFMLASVVLLPACQKEQVTADYTVIPLPQSIEKKEGSPFNLSNSTVIIYPKGNDKQKRNAEFLADYLKFETGMNLSISDSSPTENCIELQANYANENKEAYQLTVDNKKVVINGASDAATFYGIQTLRKSVPAYSDNKEIQFPAVAITDYPRFAYRGMMLDVGRHFYPLDFIKEYIDILALHNINTFHWHLTDDQGWRLEIKKYPKLTEIGSKRSETVIGKNSGKFDGKPYSGFYTQDEAREIVAYAAERYITVIPEIDLPGHMLAALTAYPELGCTGGPYEVGKKWGVFDDVLCVGNEKTFEFLENVYTELIDIFPSKFIHIGGDECPKVRWKECPKCQAKIKELGIKADKEHSAEEKLQSYCISRMEKFLNSKGRDIIGWDEILEGGLAPNATVMSWRGVEGGIAAAKQGHNAIMVPNQYLYFDYYQTEDAENEPFLGIGGNLPIEKVYSYEPISNQLTEDEIKYIIGVQANMWTEYLTDKKLVEYQLLPRIDALSEVQWTMPEKKDFISFSQRLGNMLALYKKSGYNYAKHIYNVHAEVKPNFDKKVIDVTLSTFDNAPIYYTTDGTEPTDKSILYNQPIEINSAVTLKAVAIRGKEKSNLYSNSFKFSKSTMKPIELKNTPNAKYAFGGAKDLVNGIGGGGTYADGNWIGFTDPNPIEMIIDLGESTEISSVKVGTFVSIGDWIFGATGLTVDVSEDGKIYDRAAHNSYFEASQEQPVGRVNIEAEFEPKKARYVKVSVSKTRKIPDWHPGKGSNAFIFLDEVEIN